MASIAGPDGTETFARDLRGNLTNHTVKLGEATLLDDVYTYDAAGNRTSLTSSRAAGQLTTYAYDIRNRLSAWSDQAGDHDISWDAAGNMTGLDGSERSFDARNRLVDVDGTAYTYSPDGRRLSAGDVEYTYDAFGQLASDGTSEFSYDGLGRLASQDDEQLQYAGLLRDPSAIGEVSVVRDPLGALLASDGTRAVTDARGDVIGKLDPTGSLDATIYAPFGASSSDAIGPGFQGDLQINGLVNMDARWYDTATGTFLTRDDIPLTVHEQNRYGYALGNPLTHSDPTGHCAAVAAPVCGAGYGALIGSAAGPAGTAVGAIVGVLAGLVVLGVTALAADWAIKTWTSSSSSSNHSSSSSYSSSYASTYSSSASTYTSTYSSKPYSYSPSTRYTFSASSMPAIRINIPTIRIDMPDLNYDFDFNFDFGDMVTRFGIDRPAWAYPDPFVADGATVTGAGALGIAAICGSSTSAGCLAATGTIGTSCALGGGSAASACAPALVAGLWANEPVAGAADEAGSLAYSAGGNSQIDCGPGQVLTEVGCEDLLGLLQRKVDEIRDRLANDKSARDRELSEAELERELEEPFIQGMNNGKAMERAVGQDSLIKTHFDWVGGANKPDFIAKLTGEMFELTTTNASTIAKHMARWYVDGDRIAKYVMFWFGG